MLGIPSKPTPCELGFTWSVASASRDSGSSWSRLQAGRSRDDSWLGQDPKCPIQKPILWELLAKTRVSHGKSASVLIIGCSGFPPLQTILNILKYSHMVLIAKSKSLHQIGIHGKSLYLNRELKMVTQIPWSRNPTNCSSWMFMMALCAFLFFCGVLVAVLISSEDMLRVRNLCSHRFVLYERTSCPIRCCLLGR